MPALRARLGRRRTRGSGHGARRRQDLYRARHRLLKARERLSERERRGLCELFGREPLIAEARGLKESFRAIYRAPDRDEAERRLDRFSNERSELWISRSSAWTRRATERRAIRAGVRGS